MTLYEYEALGQQERDEIIATFLMCIFDHNADKAQDFHAHMMNCSECMNVFTERLITFIQTRCEA